MEIPLLKDIVVILSLSMVVQYFFSRLKIPPIVGYLLTGVVAGPYGTALVKAVHQVEILAEIGVILLLFTIGIEFSIGNLFKLRKVVVWGGTFQIGSTMLIVTLIAYSIGLPLPKAIFWGFLISLSSTAIVLKILQGQAATETPHGRTTIGILISQDLYIVPLILVTPLLAGSVATDFSMLTFLVKIAFLLLFLILAHRWIVPFILHQIARTQNRELFLTAIALLAFGIAGLTSMIGLSLALGAFLAGLMISESEYSHNAFSLIMPLRDIFLGFFFVSVGMLLDVRVLIDHSRLVPALLAGIILIKIFTGGLAAILTKHTLRTSLLVGFALAQVGEFSFILSKVGIEFGLLTPEQNQLFLGGSVLTMMLTPFLIMPEKLIDRIFSSFPFLEKIKLGGSGLARAPKLGKMDNHLIIIGFGLNGRNLHRAALSAGIPHVVVEFNPEVVRQERNNGVPIFFGDATQLDVLRTAGLQTARTLVIAINDATATRRITHLVHRTNPATHVIVRTRFVQDVPELYQLGASEVIPEEFETSIEIFTRVLRKYLIPKQKIEELSAEIRSDGYEMLRTSTIATIPLEILNLPELEVQVIRIPRNSPFAGKTIKELQIRKKYAVNVLVIHRSGQTDAEITPQTQVQEDDRLLVMGKPGNISGLLQQIEANTPLKA